MDSTKFQQILDATITPSRNKLKLKGGWHLQIHNDPKHTLKPEWTFLPYTIKLYCMFLYGTAFKFYLLMHRQNTARHVDEMNQDFTFLKKYEYFAVANMNNFPLLHSNTTWSQCVQWAVYQISCIVRSYDESLIHVPQITNTQFANECTRLRICKNTRTIQLLCF